MVCFLFSAAVLNAAVYGDFVYEVVGGNVTITDYTGSDISVTIPDNINAYKVTRIGSSAFQSCTSLVTLVMGGYVSDIESNAFKTCGNLITVELYDGLTNINAGAFARCYKLEEVNLPETVAFIGDEAFFNCSSLPRINIRSNVTNIGYRAFWWCTELECLYLSEGIDRIGPSAFDGCVSLKTITIPSTVTDMGAEAFISCTNLASVYFKSSAPAAAGADIFDSAKPGFKIYCNAGNESGFTNAASPFAEYDLESYDGLFDFYVTCYWDTETITITDYPLNVGNVVVPSTIVGKPVYRIKESAFAGSSISSIVVSNGVELIDADAFKDCNALITAVIPGSATRIGSSLFSGCLVLKQVALGDGVGNGNIPEYMFDGCIALTNIVLPNGIRTLGQYAFHNCSSLENLVLSTNVYSIGESAFQGCSSLTEINVPGRVTYITSRVFQDCSSLTNAAITNAVLINAYAFMRCSELENIDIGTNVTSIAGWAFGSCSSLGQFSIPAGLTSIAPSVFRGCSSLTNFNVSVQNSKYRSDGIIILDWDSKKIIACVGGVTGDFDITYFADSVGESAFADCRLLRNVTFPDNLHTIEASAFVNCDSFESVYIPDSVTNIGHLAFAACKSLKSVRLPDGITSISDWLFSSCSNLTSVTFPANITRIGDYSFYNCAALKSVYFLGDAPSAAEDSSFRADKKPIGQAAYYRAGTAGWGTHYCGIPTIRCTADTPQMIPHDWLTSHFASLVSDADCEAAALADQDGDGALTWEEWVAETSATNSADYFHLSSLNILPDESQVVGWQSASNRTYSLRCHTNLFTEWPAEPLQQFVGDGSAKLYTNAPAVGGSRYYKLDVEFTP